MEVVIKGQVKMDLPAKNYFSVHKYVSTDSFVTWFLSVL